MGVRDLHRTISKDDGDADFLRGRHVQRPQQRHGHEQEHEIDKDVAKPKYIFHIPRLDRAHRAREHARLVVECGHHWPAGEDDQEDAYEGPEGHDGGDGPGCVAEFGDDFEDAVEEDEDGEFGEGDGDGVEEAVGYDELFERLG